MRGFAFAACFVVQEDAENREGRVHSGVIVDVAGKVWLMKTFWQIEEQRRRCLRKADLLTVFTTLWPRVCVRI